MDSNTLVEENGTSEPTNGVEEPTNSVEEAFGLSLSLSNDVDDGKGTSFFYFDVGILYQIGNLYI